MFHVILFLMSHSFFMILHKLYARSSFSTGFNFPPTAPLPQNMETTSEPPIDHDVTTETFDHGPSPNHTVDDKPSPILVGVPSS